MGRSKPPVVRGVDEILRDEDSFPGRSACAAEVRRLIVRFARRAKPVLIGGDTGVGKELVARALHRASPRRDGPFIAMNSACLRGPLAESHLFGHERGAFTGADRLRIGGFEEAGDGTVFLDEVGELDLAVQASLLRVLQEGEHRRLGGMRAIPCRARVVAATNRDLRAMVATGTFREDLYYRIAVLEIVVPTLRVRLGDLPEICQRLAPAAWARLTAGAFDALAEYDWPGNVRELESVLERLDALCDAEDIERDDVMAAIRRHDLCPPSIGHISCATWDGILDTQDVTGCCVDWAEEQIVARALVRAGNSQRGAGKLLGKHHDYVARIQKRIRERKKEQT